MKNVADDFKKKNYVSSKLGIILRQAIIYTIYKRDLWLESNGLFPEKPMPR